MTSTVGVLGTGLMGAAVTRRLLKLGRDVAVWNRTAARCEPLVAAGAAAAPSPGELFARSDMIFLLTATCVEVQAILERERRALAGKEVVNLVTATPAQVRSLRDLVEGAGGAFISGTLQCYPSTIGAADAVILFGGDGAVWSRREDLFRGLAGAASFVGEDPGLPNVLDASLTGCFLFTTTAAVLEAARYATSEGLTLAEFRQLIVGHVQALPGEIDRVLGAAERGDFASADAGLDIYERALELFQTAFGEAGAPDTLLDATLRKVRNAVAAGDGSQGIAALFRH